MLCAHFVQTLMLQVACFMTIFYVRNIYKIIPIYINHLSLYLHGVI